MKKYLLVLLVLALVVAIPSSAFAETKIVSDGTYLYAVTTGSVFEKFSAITASQIKHLSGYSTTCSAHSSYTSSKEASASISAGASFFVELTVASHTTGGSVSVNIPDSKPTNWYRLEQRFPGYRINKTIHTLEPALVWSQIIAYAPIKDGSYHLLVIYDPLKPSQMGTEAP